MNIEKKLRRAFRRATPNVMDTHRTATPKRRRKVSLEFISIAASIALLISAAGGGFLYFRDYFSPQSSQGSGSSGNSHGEGLGTLPDLGIDWQEPVPPDGTELKFPLTEEDAKAIALSHAATEYDNCIVYDCQLVDYTYYRIGIACAYPNYSHTGGDFSFRSAVYFVHTETGAFLNPVDSAGSALKEAETEAEKIASAQAEAMFGTFQITNCEFHFRSGVHSFYEFTVLVNLEYGEKEFRFTVLDWTVYETVEEPVVPPVDITLTMTGARDIALGMWDHYVDNIHCLKISENSDFYTVYYEQGEYAYESHIDFDGNVIYDAGAQHIGLRADQQMIHLIGWEKARSIALDACGRDVSELIGFTYEYCPGDPDCYHLELYFPDDGFTYRIGALEGELLEGPNVDFTPPEGCITVEDATKIAMEYTGHLEDYLAGTVTDLACKFDEYGNPASYYVYFCVGNEHYEVGILADTGKVLFCDCYAIDEPILDGLTQDQAIEIALNWCGIAADQAIGLQCRFVDTELESCYRVCFHNGIIQYEVFVHPTTGDLLGCQETPIATVYTEADAIQAALGYSNLNADNYPVIECHQVGTETNRTIYLVICKGGVTITTMVDANTLRIMDHGMGSFPEAALSREEARTIASKVCGLEDEGPLGHPSIGMFNDGVLFYCNTIYWDEMVYVVVMDANTGEVLAQSKFENTRIPGRILTEDQALEYALANAFVSLADAEDPVITHDADSQTFTVTFRYQGDTCTAIVDDYNGAIIDLYWIVDE